MSQEDQSQQIEQQSKTSNANPPVLKYSRRYAVQMGKPTTTCACQNWMLAGKRCHLPWLTMGSVGRMTIHQSLQKASQSHTPPHKRVLVSSLVQRYSALCVDQTRYPIAISAYLTMLSAQIQHLSWNTADPVMRKQEFYEIFMNFARGILRMEFCM